MVMGFTTPRLMILYYGSEINGLIVSVTGSPDLFQDGEPAWPAANVALL